MSDWLTRRLPAITPRPQWGHLSPEVQEGLAEAEEQTLADRYYRRKARTDDVEGIADNIWRGAYGLGDAVEGGIQAVLDSPFVHGFLDPELTILSGKQAPEWANFLAGLDPEHPQADEIFPWEPSQYLGASIGLPLAVASAPFTGPARLVGKTGQLVKRISPRQIARQGEVARNAPFVTGQQGYGSMDELLRPDTLDPEVIKGDTMHGQTAKSLLEWTGEFQSHEHDHIGPMLERLYRQMGIDLPYRGRVAGLGDVMADDDGYIELFRGVQDHTRFEELLDLARARLRYAETGDEGLILPGRAGDAPPHLQEGDEILQLYGGDMRPQIFGPVAPFGFQSWTLDPATARKKFAAQHAASGIRPIYLAEDIIPRLAADDALFQQWVRRTGGHPERMLEARTDEGRLYADQLAENWMSRLPMADPSGADPTGLGIHSDTKDAVYRLLARPHEVLAYPDWDIDIHNTREMEAIVNMFDPLTPGADNLLNRIERLPGTTENFMRKWLRRVGLEGGQMPSPTKTYRTRQQIAELGGEGSLHQGEKSRHYVSGDLDRLTPSQRVDMSEFADNRQAILNKYPDLDPRILGTPEQLSPASRHRMSQLAERKAAIMGGPGTDWNGLMVKYENMAQKLGPEAHDNFLQTKSMIESMALHGDPIGEQLMMQVLQAKTPLDELPYRGFLGQRNLP